MRCWVLEDLAHDCDGAFVTRCLLNIWGTMLFLRLTWVIGQCGIWQVSKAQCSFICMINIKHQNSADFDENQPGLDGNHCLQHHHRSVRFVHVGNLNQWTDRSWRCLLHDLQVRPCKENSTRLQSLTSGLLGQPLEDLSGLCSQ